jgi:hypothetical protein
MNRSSPNSTNSAPSAFGWLACGKSVGQAFQQVGSWHLIASGDSGQRVVVTACGFGDESPMTAATKGIKCRNQLFLRKHGP